MRGSRKPYLLLLVALLPVVFWGFFTYLGYDLLLGVIHQGVAGYPNPGQWGLYVEFPAAMLLVSASVAIFANRIRTDLCIGAIALEVMPILPFLMVYGGGV